MKESPLDYDERGNGIGGVPKVGEGKGYRDWLDGVFGLDLGRGSLESWLLGKGSTLWSPPLLFLLTLLPAYPGTWMRLLPALLFSGQVLSDSL